MQQFGSFWTEEKLKALEKYLQFYTTALGNSGFKLCYIDAFAGSGSIVLKGGAEIEGSAVRALRYPFDKYLFFEAKQEIIDALKEKVGSISEHKNVEYHRADCNDFLLEIDKVDWKKQHWRGVIFLDPCAMDLAWNCLNRISLTGVFDVWYLFPFSAVNRNLYKNGKIPLANRKALNEILGTNDWEDKIYSNSPQMSFLDEVNLEKANTTSIKNYILSRLWETFPTVSPKAVLLQNERNSPMFLLCFAGSNPNPKAQGLSLKAANYILEHI